MWKVMESGCAEAAMADGAQAFSHDGAPERFQDSGKGWKKSGVF